VLPYKTEVGCCSTIGWLWLVGSLKLQVSFAEYSLFYRALLQKRPIFLGSLLIVATPYRTCDGTHSNVHHADSFVHITSLTHTCVNDIFFPPQSQQGMYKTKCRGRQFRGQESYVPDKIFFFSSTQSTGYAYKKM